MTPTDEQTSRENAAEVQGPDRPAQPPCPINVRLGDGAEAALLQLLTFRGLGLEARRVASSLNAEGVADITVGWFADGQYAGALSMRFHPGRVGEYAAMYLEDGWQGEGIYTNAMLAMDDFDDRYPVSRWEHHIGDTPQRDMMVRSGWKATGKRDKQGLNVLTLEKGQGRRYFTERYSN